MITMRMIPKTTIRMMMKQRVSPLAFASFMFIFFIELLHVGTDPSLLSGF